MDWQMRIFKVLIFTGILVVPSQGIHLNLSTAGLDLGLFSNNNLTIEVPIQYYSYINNVSSNSYQMRDQALGVGLQVYWLIPRYNQASISFGSGIIFCNKRFISVIPAYDASARPQVLVRDEFSPKINILTVQPEYTFYEGIFSAYLNYTILSWYPYETELNFSFFSSSFEPTINSAIKFGVKWNISKFLDLKKQEKETSKERPLAK